MLTFYFKVFFLEDLWGILWGVLFSWDSWDSWCPLTVFNALILNILTTVTSLYMQFYDFLSCDAIPDSQPIEFVSKLPNEKFVPFSCYLSHPFYTALLISICMTLESTPSIFFLLAKRANENCLIFNAFVCAYQIFYIRNLSISVQFT